MAWLWKDFLFFFSFFFFFPFFLFPFFPVGIRPTWKSSHVNAHNISRQQWNYFLTEKTIHVMMERSRYWVCLVVSKHIKHGIILSTPLNAHYRKSSRPISGSWSVSASSPRHGPSRIQTGGNRRHGSLSID